MARVTVEDCLKVVGNRFSLVHLAASRVRQLEKGSKRLVGSKNKNTVEALREIATGKVKAKTTADEGEQILSPFSAF